MALFNIPKREEKDIHKILEKAREEKEYKPAIKIKGNSLLSKLNIISKNVEKNLGKEKDNYLCITTDEEFLEYIDKAVEDGVVAIDTETNSLDSILTPLVGVCLQSPNQKPCYVPVNHISAIMEKRIDKQVNIETIKVGMKKIVDNNTKVIMHNSYFDCTVLYKNCGILIPVYWDVLLASNLLNENEPHGLKELYDKYIMNGDAGVHKFGELFEGIPFCYIPYNIGYIYGAHDAEMTLDMYNFQKPYLTKGSKECIECGLEGSARILMEEEMPLVPMLVDMKIRGVHIDYDRAKELHNKYVNLKQEAIKEFEESLEVYKNEIDAYNSKHSVQVPYPINFNSPQQLAIFLYDIANIGTVIRKKPRGTGKDVRDSILHLDRLKGDKIINVVRALSKVKQYDKALGSFIDKIPVVAKEHNGTVHCNFNSAGTVSGRFSSSDFNLQNIPSHMTDIRQLFTAGEGRMFIGADFSKQELIICACACNDELLIESFHKGLDTYSHVASLAYGVPYEDCLEHYKDGTTNDEGKERRSAAKKVVLGLLYGKGVKSIGEELHIPEEKAQEVYDSVLKAFPTLAQYMYGRKRRLPDLLLPKYEFEFPKNIDESTKKYYTAILDGKLKKCKWKRDIDRVKDYAYNKGINIRSNNMKIADAERQVINSLIQSAAANITKKAIINICTNKRLKELDVKLEITVHDENICSCPEENVAEAAPIIQKCMTDAGIGLQIPLKTDVAISKCWYGDEYKIENGKLVKL